MYEVVFSVTADGCEKLQPRFQQDRPVKVWGGYKDLQGHSLLLQRNLAFWI